MKKWPLLEYIDRFRITPQAQMDTPTGRLLMDYVRAASAERVVQTKEKKKT